MGKVHWFNDSTYVIDQGFETSAGTKIITASRTFIMTGGVQTTAGTVVFTRSGTHNPDLAVNTGSKALVQFWVQNMITSATTFMFSGGVDALTTATPKPAYIPWNGYVLGIGARCSGKITAGNATFSLFNGSTALGCTVTLNTTNHRAVNGSLQLAGPGSTPKQFSANALKCRIKTNAALAGANNDFFTQVWISV